MKTATREGIRDCVLRIVVGLAIGIVMACAAGSFLSIAGFFKKTSQFFKNYASNHEQWWVGLSPIIILLISALLILLVRRIFGISRFQTPKETIQAVEESKTVNTKDGLAATIASLISVSGGASVGQYGPLVVFGGTIGSLISKYIGTNLPASTWIGCGVAGAIGGGFGTPLAAIVFSHEVVLRRFSLKDVTPVALSAITASILVDNSWFERRLRLNHNIDNVLTELLPFIVLCAPVFALSAILFMSLLKISIGFVDRYPTKLNQILILGAIFCGTGGLMIPDAMGLGLDVISNLLSGTLSSNTVALLVVSKLIFTLVCISSGLHGGIYLPSLFIGAGVGCLLGKAFSVLGIAGSASLGLVGMAAVAAAVFGAPISTVLIIFEFTRSYEVAILAMITVTICTLITSETYGSSFFSRN